MKFKLYSNFKPTGDQPQAIKKLVEGLKKGYRDQTLLGVTGSGKSLISKSPVILRQGDKIFTVNIGEFIDQILNNFKEKIKIINDSEVIFTKDLPKTYFKTDAYSFNPLTKIVSWQPITQFIRHKSPDKLYKVKSQCGREIIVTDNHNFFVLRKGQLKLIETSAALDNDHLPLPLNIKSPKKNIKHIQLDELLTNKKTYVSISNFKSIWQSRKKETIKSIVGYNKIYHILKNNERIPLGIYKKLLTKIPTLKKEAKIGTYARDYQLPLKFLLSDKIMRLLGYYIAEGHSSNKYFILSSGDEEIVSDFKATLRSFDVNCRWRPNSYDYQISSDLWNNILHILCGKNSQNKHLPYFWPQLSQSQLSNLLKAYFSGDGGVDKEEVNCTTASFKLASDIAYALYRFGIVARIKNRRIKIPGKNKRGEYWTIKISGQKFLNIYKNKIGFTVHKKEKKLNKIINKSYNTNVDVVPMDHDWFKTTRKELSLTQKDISKKCNLVRSAISLIENGQRKPSRITFNKIIEILLDEAKKKKSDKTIKQIKEQKSLLNLFWTPIKSIERVKKEQFVYDFAVKNNETFLAGAGGIFVHNTFAMANIIEKVQRPTLVISHNKTLAAQLYGEFRQFFPENAVHYFVSYYDYYQPEAYIPHTDTYIEKEATINEEIDRLRHAATQSLLNRDDVLIVASVSCIYGLGEKEDYEALGRHYHKGQTIKRNDLLKELVKIQYVRDDIEFKRGSFMVKGENVEIHLATGEAVVRITLYGDTIDKISIFTIKPGSSKLIIMNEMRNGQELKEVIILPAKHYMTPESRIKSAMKSIREELRQRLKELKKQGKIVEAERLERKTNYDLEMLEEVGYANGIENYSRHLSGRAPGSPPATLMDFFSKDYIVIIDESHATIPQIRGMYAGDQSRKQTLIDFGFRLPSARDNRPLNFEEFNSKINQVIYASATPSAYEIRNSKQVVEQIIRPTGLLDPEIEVRPTTDQIEDLIKEIKIRVDKKQRVLVTTLTKRMSEELTSFLQERGINVQYLHSEVETLERVDILRDLREGKYDVLVGINLLREGLDLPEVSLVAILDADMSGFLRNETSLIQTMGRAARHAEGRVIMYGDKITPAMRYAINETKRRRRIQEDYNKKHHITPKTTEAGLHKSML